MNRIFYAMIVVAFATAVYFEFTDPKVALTDADRTALIEAVDADGPGALKPWLVARDVNGQVDAMARSAGLSRKALLERLRQQVAALPDPTGEAVAATVSEVGDFGFDEQSAMERFGAGLFDMAKTAVMGVVLPLIGAMAFFLGLMKVAEDAGAMKVIAKVLRPVMRLLFPDVPANHPAMSAMILNIAANALGLGNAATPFGIKAMQELDKLNAVKGTATNAMCLFLAINTSGVTILPTGVIAIRAALGSADPAGIMGTTLIATMCSTTAAIIAAKVYQRFSPVVIPSGPGSELEETLTAETTPPEPADEEAYPLWVSLAAMAGLLLSLPLMMSYGSWIVPLLVVGFTTYGVVAGVPVYESFVKGATEGWEVARRIVPFLVAILAAVGMLRGAGAIDLFVDTFGPYTEMVGFPAPALPMALLRPLTGSGAYGVMMATLTEYGVDSQIGYLVSTFQGTTETTFYVIAVYFGAVSVSRTRHAIAAALTADVVGIAAAVIAVSVYFAM